MQCHIAVSFKEVCTWKYRYPVCEWSHTVWFWNLTHTPMRTQTYIHPLTYNTHIHIRTPILCIKKQTNRTHISLECSYRALLNGAPFTQKLHLIYLVNDVLHHWWVVHVHIGCFRFRISEHHLIRSVRKRADDLKNQLENIVIPMFCSGQMRKCH